MTPPRKPLQVGGAKRKRPPVTTHNLCGEITDIPPALCVRCFRVKDVRKAVMAERRRVVRIVEMYMDHLPEDALAEINVRAGGAKAGT